MLADLWDRLLDRATTYVDVLVYIGMFITEKPLRGAINRMKSCFCKIGCITRIM